MLTSFRRSSLPALVGLACVALVLATCSSDNNSTGSTVQSSSGTASLDGTWVRCTSESGGTYEKASYEFSGSTVSVTNWTNLTQSTCSDASGSGSGNMTASFTVIGTKSVSFSADGTIEDSSAPSGLTQPVTSTTVDYTVTSSSDPTNGPKVGEVFKALLFINSDVTPNLLYEDKGDVGTDGYPSFLDSVSPLTKQ